MNKITFRKVQLFLFSLGYSEITYFKEIKEGINSQVYKLRVGKDNLVVKVYNKKNKLRIKREKIFYDYLRSIKNNNVIEPIGFNIKSNLAIFPCIEGKKIKKIKNNHIKELLNFLRQINKKKSIKLPLAVDGIKNRNNHIKLCELKIDQMKKIRIDSLIKKKFMFFLKEKIIPKFNQIKMNYYKQKTFCIEKNNLLKDDMIVSPSDFGFHNIIQSNNKFFFFDFEYAGLDDPIKLICDFYCQPNQILTQTQKKMFIRNIPFKKNSLKQLELYTKIFLPFHKLKWCCIILNEFKNENINSSRKLSNERNQIMKIQLRKAKIYFSKNF
jgi:thiamine kinase-like enzyme